MHGITEIGGRPSVYTSGFGNDADEEENGAPARKRSNSMPIPKIQVGD